MVDSFSKKIRSEIMSNIKSKNTKIEMKFKKLIFGRGFRYQPKMFGRPDFASNKFKIAIFIDSCFWHKCSKHFRMPSSNSLYWKLKIKRNLERDKEVNKHLRKKGWKVIRIWEHEINKNPKNSLKKIKIKR